MTRKDVTWTAIIVGALVLAAFVLDGPARGEPFAPAVPRASQIAATQSSLWRCQNRVGQPRSSRSVPPWNLPRTSYRRWVLHLWQRRHAQCTATFKRRLAHTLPATNDWVTAVRVTQRVYPGTDDWMLSMSDRESSWGRWVWYGGGAWRGYHIGNDFLGADTVGGWMQFRYTTFAPYWRAAQEDLRRRGFFLPVLRMPAAGGDPKYVGWLNPLGQALTAGYMRYYHKDGCHWCL